MRSLNSSFEIPRGILKSFGYYPEYIRSSLFAKSKSSVLIVQLSLLQSYKIQFSNNFAAVYLQSGLSCSFVFNN
jgi:hypothetical protein